MAGLATQAFAYFVLTGADSQVALVLTVFGMFAALVLGAISVRQSTGKIGFALGGVQLGMAVLATMLVLGTT